MIVKLLLKSGKKAGTVIPIGQTSFIIGRHPESDLRIDSKVVSLRHCLITLANGYVLVSDLESSNGTYINGELIGSKHKVLNQDLLTIGTFEFEFVILPTGLITLGDENRFESTVILPPSDNIA